MIGLAGRPTCTDEGGASPRTQSEQPVDITSPVDDTNNRQRPAGRIVDEHVRAHRPEPHRLIGQILAGMAYPGIFCKESTCIQESQAKLTSSFVVVCRHVGPYLPDVTGGLRGQAEALHRSSGFASSGLFLLKLSEELLPIHAVAALE